MRRLSAWLLCLSLASTLVVPAHNASAQSGVSINLRIGDRYRGPDLGFYGEPNVVAVPGRGDVYYVTDSDQDVYRNNNYWYLNSNGDWYRASDYRGPWVFVGYRSVPRNVYTVPSEYRKRWTDYRDAHYDWGRSARYGDNYAYTAATRTRTSVTLRIGDPYRGPDLGFYQEPQVYSVNGSSGVYYVRDTNQDVYRFGNNWYMNYNGDWYRASDYRGPFTFVGYQSVPRAVYTVPSRYKRNWRNFKDTHYTNRTQTRTNTNRYGNSGSMRIGDRYSGPNLGFYDQPNMIRIPGRGVYYVGDSDYDVYRAGNYWYLNYNGDWYRSSSYRGPWGFVGYRSVPREVYTVPAQYRRTWSDYRDRNYDYSATTGNGTTYSSGDVGLQIGDRYAGPDLGFYGEPRLVAVPGGRGVNYVRDSDSDVYRYGTTWYMNYNGDWYRANTYGGPFVFVGYRSVPRDVYTVPTGYRRNWTDYRDVHYNWDDSNR